MPYEEKEIKCEKSGSTENLVIHHLTYSPRKSTVSIIDLIIRRI